MKTLMVQGTTSDAGKSTLVAGLCRVLSDANIKVAPCVAEPRIMARLTVASYGNNMEFS